MKGAPRWSRLLVALSLGGCASVPPGEGAQGPVSIVVDNQRLQRYTLRIGGRELGWAGPLRTTLYEVDRDAVEGRRTGFCLLGPGSMRNVCLGGLISIPVGVATIRLKALDAAVVSRRRGDLCRLEVTVFDADGELMASRLCT